MELKDIVDFIFYCMSYFNVSNSPCGVESEEPFYIKLAVRVVSNSPCGVESKFPPSQALKTLGFLIHRVELKVLLFRFFAWRDVEFLIHRVELKENSRYSCLYRR